MIFLWIYLTFSHWNSEGNVCNFPQQMIGAASEAFKYVKGGHWVQQRHLCMCADQQQTNNDPNSFKCQSGYNVLVIPLFTSPACIVWYKLPTFCVPMPSLDVRDFPKPRAGSLKIQSSCNWIQSHVRLKLGTRLGLCVFFFTASVYRFVLWRTSSEIVLRLVWHGQVTEAEFYSKMLQLLWGWYENSIIFNGGFKCLLMRLNISDPINLSRGRFTSISIWR